MKQLFPAESLYGDVDGGTVNVHIHQLIFFVNKEDDRGQHYHTQLTLGNVSS